MTGVGMVDLISPALAGIYAAATVGSPVPAVVASVLAFLLALLGRHLLGRAALRWWLALRGTRPDERAEIIRALTRQPPTPAPAPTAPAPTDADVTDSDPPRRIRFLRFR